MAHPDRVVWCVDVDKVGLLYPVCMAQSLSSAWLSDTAYDSIIVPYI